MNVMQSSSATHNPMPVGVYRENASLGSSGVAETRSLRNIATSAPIAKMIRPALASGDPTIDAEDIAAMPRQINPTRPAGTPPLGAWRPEGIGGKVKSALKASMPATAAVATNAPRQLP